MLRSNRCVKTQGLRPAGPQMRQYFSMCGRTCDFTHSLTQSNQYNSLIVANLNLRRSIFYTPCIYQIWIITTRSHLISKNNIIRGAILKAHIHSNFLCKIVLRGRNTAQDIVEFNVVDLCSHAIWVSIKLNVNSPSIKEMKRI